MARAQVIEYFDPTNRSIVARYPENGSAEIPHGAQLIVQQNQEAVFFRDGHAMDRFGPGRHKLTSQSVPLIARILPSSWEKSPFQTTIYFVGKQTFVDQKWGTRQPISLRDPELGVVRLRGFGRYSFRVTDSAVLINTLVGTQGKYTTAEISDFLRDLIVARLTDVLGKMEVGVYDLSARFEEIASAARIMVAEDFTRFGLEIVDFFINAITLPPEVQRALDSRASMKALGDMREYTMYQTANSMRRMAEEGTDGRTPASGGDTLLPGYLRKSLEGTGNARDRDASWEEIAKTHVDSRALVQQVAQAAGWKCDPVNQGFRLVVPLGPVRRQTVNISFAKDRDGNAMIQIQSTCGPALEDRALALLRMNRSLAHGAYAIDSSSSGDMVVMQSNQLADTADPMELTRAISAVAWQSDLAEQQLLGNDTH